MTIASAPGFSCLQRNTAFAAMRRLGSLLRLKLKPRNFRSSGRATLLFASFTLSFSRRVRKRMTFVITRCPAARLRDVAIAVIRIPCEAMFAPFELAIEFVEYDVR